MTTSSDPADDSGSDPGTSSDETSGPDEPTEGGAVVTGVYRNLFAEAGYDEAEITAKVDAAYEQLFHGEPSEQAVMVEMGANESGPLAQIRDIASMDVRSEGMSYGMMIAVQHDRPEDFDALWNWSYTYMRHDDPSHPAYRYFSWSVSYDGVHLDPMPAPDGEEYFAMALYFADARWGSGAGVYDYRAHADDLLDAMKNRADIDNGTSLFNVEHKQVRFTPNVYNFPSNGDHTDPSYHLPAFYELWAEWGPPADAQFWRDAATVSRDFFVATTNDMTALSPDYANFDGTPKGASWDAGTANFRFDAWRTSMNWAFDWSWYEADPRQQELTDLLHAFFTAQGPGYGNHFTLDGMELSGDHSPGLVAMNAAATLAATDPGDYAFVEELWDTAVPTGFYRYYDGMLYMLGLMHVAGEFRAYRPR
ncbi:MAG: glycosyl hydrolase family 8 [Myxococcota bacterium]